MCDSGGRPLVVARRRGTPPFRYAVPDVNWLAWTSSDIRRALHSARSLTLDARAGLRRVDRLRGSGELCHQHPGRVGVRISASLGRGRRERHGHGRFNTSRPSWAWSTGQNLPEICRARSGHVRGPCLWIQAEIMAIATDLAELVGAALGLNLCSGYPWHWPEACPRSSPSQSCDSSPAGTDVLSSWSRAALLVAHWVRLRGVQGWPERTSGSRRSRTHFAGQQSVLLAVAIVGATVMPHAIYLHSDLAKQHRLSKRSPSVGQLIKGQRIDVLDGAGRRRIGQRRDAGRGCESISPPRRTDGRIVATGSHVALAPSQEEGQLLAFAATLFVSGVSSSTVGTYAGQVVMQGFTGRSIPVLPAGCHRGTSVGRHCVGCQCDAGPDL